MSIQFEIRAPTKIFDFCVLVPSRALKFFLNIFINTWGKDTVQKGREHFAAKKWCATTDPKFANRVEEDLATKRQGSAET